MKKTLTVTTLVIVAILGAAVVFAGFTAPTTSATSSFCHTTTLSIKVAATVAPGKTLTVTGKEARVPAHTVKATLQSRKSTSTTWVNGSSVNLSSTGSYSLKWKAPAKKGSYKIRVRITHSGASHRSATRTVAVQ